MIKNLNDDINKLSASLVIFFIFFIQAIYLYNSGLLVSSIYPRFNDQIQYLSDSYNLYEYLKDFGFTNISKNINFAKAQGVTYQFLPQLFLLFNVSRLSVLFVNFLFLFLFQFSLYKLFRFYKYPRSFSLGIIFISTFISGYYEINAAGSIFDYRLDFMASALFGISSYFLCKTENFTRHKYIILLAFILAFSILTRFILAPYFFVLMLTYLLFIGYKSDFIDLFKKVVLFLTIFIVVLSPIYYSFPFIESYYLGHFVGPEALIRASSTNEYSLKFLKYIEYTFRHLKPALFIYILPLLLYFTLSYKKKNFLKEQQIQRVSLFFISLLYFIAPIFILSFDYQMSKAAGTAAVPGLMMMFSWLLGFCPFLILSKKNKYLFLFFLLSFFLVFFVYSYNKNLQKNSDNYQFISKNHNMILDRINEMSINKPIVNIGVNRITDSVDALVLNIVNYETRNSTIKMSMVLPDSIYSTNIDQLINKLILSDIFFYYAEKQYIRWPYDKTMSDNSERILDILQDQFTLIECYNINSTFCMYMKNN